MIRCNVCGIDNGDDSAFCAKCGNRLSYKETPTSIESTDVRAKKKSHKKAIIAAVSAGLALLVIAVVIVALLLSNAKSEERVFYIKDGELYTRIPGSEDRPVEITNGLMQDSVDSKTMSALTADRVDGLVYLCSDNETVFYPEELNYIDDSFSLYFTYLGQNVSVKIASGITEYSVLSDGQVVLYRKGDSLYLYDVKKQDSNKIANDTVGYYSNEDGSRILYFTEGRDVWAFTEGNKTKIATDIENIEGVFDGCSNLYYVKNGSLYKASYIGDNVKIEEDVDEVLEIYSSGEIYYLKKPEKDRVISDYLFDDHLEREYSGTYEYLLKAYGEVTIPEFERKLYYYDPNSEEASLITDCFVKGTEDCSYDQPVMIYENYNSEKFKFFEFVQELEEVETPEEYNGKKGKEAQLEWYYDHWITCLKESVNHYVVVKDKAYNIDVPEAFRYEINDAGNNILAIKGMRESYSEDAIADLYLISIDGGIPQSPNLLAKDIWSFWYGFSKNDEVYYYKNFDMDNNTADLYIGKERIDEVSLVINYTHIGVDPTEVVYYSDWDDNNSQGTLKLYRNREKRKVKDDVSSYKVTSSGNLLFLQDYDSKRERGELFLYKESETRLIDSDVAAIVSLNTYTHKGRRDSRMYLYYDDYWYHEKQAIKEKLQEAAVVASSLVATDITKSLSEVFSSIDNHEDYYDDAIVSETRDYNDHSDYSDNYWDNNYQDSNNTISDATYFMYAYASSELPDQGGHSYSAMNVLYDDDLCWCEGVDGNGVGESITLYLPEKQRLYGIRLINGYVGTEKQYNDNGKITDVEISFSNGLCYYSHLNVYDDDSRNTVQTIDFKELMGGPVETDYVTITIYGVEPGKYSDTCLSYVGTLSPDQAYHMCNLGIATATVNTREGVGGDCDMLTDLNGKKIQLPTGEEVYILEEKKADDGNIWYWVEFYRNGICYRGYVTSTYIAKDEENSKKMYY